MGSQCSHLVEAYCNRCEYEGHVTRGAESLELDCPCCRGGQLVVVDEQRGGSAKKEKQNGNGKAPGWSDAGLLAAVKTLEDAEALLQIDAALRDEFQTAETLFGYVKATRAGRIKTQCNQTVSGRATG